MFKKILIGLVAVFAIFAIVVSRQPEDFKVSRSITINAPASKIYPQLSDFKAWEKWSPWEKMDLSMKKTYEGKPGAVGSTYAWAGNNKVGEGKMTILKAEAPRALQLQLDFLKPMKATNLTDFTLAPEGKGTVVTWSMAGKNNFASKAVCMFMDMDKMVGGDFEKGLNDLKAVAEGK